MRRPAPARKAAAARRKAPPSRVLRPVEPEQVGLSSERLARIGTAFEEQVQRGRLPGAVVLVARHGQLAYWQAVGRRDPAKLEPMQRNDLFRIYSMTKPIVSVGIMMLVEEGRLLLNDPVSKYLPNLGGRQVAVPDSAPAAGYRLERAQRDITVQDLLRHTSGLTYGFRETHLKRVYEQAEEGIQDLTNAQVVERLAELPVAFQPGTVWEYSRSTDVLGYLIEVLSGQSLEMFLQERILGPLGMDDTAFHAPLGEQHRLAQPGPDPLTGQPQAILNVLQPPRFQSGGGGLVSSAGDYARFAQMLLNGGELEGVRLLGPRTLRLMAADHLGGIAHGKEFIAGPGHGFGLGFAVRLEAGQAPVPGSVGEFFWSGAAGTHFWVDPQEALIAVMMIQAPSLRQDFRQLIRNVVLQAIVA
ncbi:MAG TPA: serine hydrolase domain-containing protein [bacterium]|nr:serine hydrolase domain-containing protein [bacterium]